MLRFKATRIALIEDDLCYHIDSIFSRHDQLAKWHQQHTDSNNSYSNNSYDGDNDDDGLFLDSDTFSLPQTLFESGCDDSQSQALADDNAQDSSQGGRSTQVIVGDTRAHSLDGLPSTDWERLRKIFTSQHNHSIPNSALSQLNDVVLDTILARLFSSITALPLRTSHPQCIGHSENSREAILPLNSLGHNLWIGLKVKDSPLIGPLKLSASQLPGKQLIPWESASSLLKMEHSRRTKPESANERLDAHGMSEAIVAEASAQECLTEMPSNSGSAAQPHSTPQDPDFRKLKRRSSSPSGMAASHSQGLRNTGAIGGSDAYFKSVSHPVHRKTVSRGTQTDPGLATPTEAIERDTVNLFRNCSKKQENIAPDSAAPQSPVQRPGQDPLISAMFTEPDAHGYDATGQMHRGMQGYVIPPVRRGRIPRYQEGVLGQLVHPTLVDAAVFQEYVHQLIAELDRAP
ncbi:hypothetical protein BDW59DRAFT_1555 [Aspergillus cavernicola]|uniref:Uncharacterized protein n=1 Tax=Aspergillus cavernicola TaxID=176166 RepID=A0ABR4J4I4_9EURO